MGCIGISNENLQACERYNPLKDSSRKIPPWLRGKLNKYKNAVTSISFAGSGSFGEFGSFYETEKMGNYKYCVCIVASDRGIVKEFMLFFKKIK